MEITDARTAPTAAEHSEAMVEVVIESFVHAATDAAHTVFHDAPTRAAYIAECLENARALLAQVASGQMSPKEAGLIAVKLSNVSLAAARGEVTDFGLAVSEALKETGKRFPSLSRLAGRACIALSVSLAIYYIANADDKVRETAKQGAAVAGGIVGFKVGGTVGALLCGPPCAVVGALAGSVAGALAAEFAADRSVSRIRA